MSIFLIPTPEGLAVLYDDELALDDLVPGTYDVKLRRNSHVNPVPGAKVQFQIEWQPPFSDKFGPVTLTDENGNPFLTKRAAIDCEIHMILHDFYGIPTSRLKDQKHEDRGEDHDGHRETLGSREGGARGRAGITAPESAS